MSKLNQLKAEGKVNLWLDFRRNSLLDYSRCGSLWSVGKFISTIGNVSAETIKKYIADQKGT